MPATSAAPFARLRAPSRSKGRIAATVGPMLVALRSPLAWSQGTENMVIAQRPLRRRRGLLRSRRRRPSHGGRRGQRSARARPRLAPRRDSFSSRRASAPSSRFPTTSASWSNDRPGIVAAITTALANEQINIRAIVQKPGYPADALPFVVTVEPCKILGAASAPWPASAPWIACWSSRSTCRCSSRIGSGPAATLSSESGSVFALVRPESLSLEVAR